MTSIVIWHNYADGLRGLWAVSDLRVSSADNVLTDNYPKLSTVHPIAYEERISVARDLGMCSRPPLREVRGSPSPAVRLRTHAGHSGWLQLVRDLSEDRRIHLRPLPEAGSSRHGWLAKSSTLK